MPPTHHAIFSRSATGKKFHHTHGKTEQAAKVKQPNGQTQKCFIHFYSLR